MSVQNKENKTWNESKQYENIIWKINGQKFDFESKCIGACNARRERCQIRVDKADQLPLMRYVGCVTDVA